MREPSILPKRSPTLASHAASKRGPEAVGSAVQAPAVGIVLNSVVANTRSAREIDAIKNADKNAEIGKVNIISALPGTGKTTLLETLVLANNDPSVYLMFNRKPCDVFQTVLQEKGATHSTAMTFHKLAFDAVKETGIKVSISDELPKEIFKMTYSTGQGVAELLHNDPFLSRNWFKKALAGEWNVVSDVVLHWMATATMLPELLKTSTVQKLLSARRIYVDEAQDMSRSMVMIVRNCLTNASIILAGDTNQHINQFMGAADPIGNRRFFPEATILPLSSSWRFHRQIADAFNSVTNERCIGRSDQPLSGTGPIIIQCGTNKVLDTVMDWLKKNDIKAKKREKNSGEVPAGTVEVSTVHKAKGGGWHICIVMEDVMKCKRDLAKYMIATAVSRAREMLYVHKRIAIKYQIRSNSHVKTFESLDDIKHIFDS